MANSKAQGRTPKKGWSLSDLIPFRQLLEMRDTLQDYTEDGERKSLFYSSGIVWRMHPQTRAIEVIVVDYFDSVYTFETQIKFPGLKSQFNESMREAFNRAIKAQTGFTTTNNEWLIYAHQDVGTPPGTAQLRHAKGVFAMRVGYDANQNLAELTNIIEGSEYQNPRWHPIGEELLQKIFHTNRAPYYKFMKVIIGTLPDRVSKKKN